MTKSCVGGAGGCEPLPPGPTADSITELCAAAVETSPLKTQHGLGLLWTLRKQIASGNAGADGADEGLEDRSFELGRRKLGSEVAVGPRDGWEALKHDPRPAGSQAVSIREPMAPCSMDKHKGCCVRGNGDISK